MAAINVSLKNTKLYINTYNISSKHVLYFACIHLHFDSLFKESAIYIYIYTVERPLFNFFGMLMRMSVLFYCTTYSVGSGAESGSQHKNTRDHLL